MMTSDKSPRQSEIALVTGGAVRIGAAIVKKLVSAGYNVICGFNASEAAARQLEQELGAGALRLLAIDLVNPESAAAAARAAVEKAGRLDLLVNNAAVFPAGALSELDLDRWRRTLTINLDAPLALCLALREWLTASGGSIVNICDIHGVRPIPGHTAYCVSKAGLIMLTQSLALELAPRVRVNGINPGAILLPSTGTPELESKLIATTPLARLGCPEDIADAVLFLARAPYITGEILVVDGGRSLTT